MQTDVLDHGYVELVETWGSDERIIQAARMSTGKGFQGWGSRCKKCGHTFDDKINRCDLIDCGGTESAPGDEKLLKFLWDHKHATPFEMAGLTIEVKAPIMVFREWHRHRTQSYNEMSARYTPLPDENYVPSLERLMTRGTANKQASAAAGSKVLDEETACAWRADLVRVYRDLQDVYERGLYWGVPKELARLPVPVGRYSKMRASANLRNWLAFVTLRSDGAAQWEIRQYSDAVGKIISEKFPRTWAVYSVGSA